MISAARVTKTLEQYPEPRVALVAEIGSSRRLAQAVRKAWPKSTLILRGYSALPRSWILRRRLNEEPCKSDKPDKLLASLQPLAPDGNPEISIYDARASALHEGEPAIIVGAPTLPHVLCSYATPSGMEYITSNAWEGAGAGIKPWRRTSLRLPPLLESDHAITSRSRIDVRQLPVKYAEAFRDTFMTSNQGQRGANSMFGIGVFVDDRLAGTIAMAYAVSPEGAAFAFYDACVPHEQRLAKLVSGACATTEFAELVERITLNKIESVETTALSHNRNPGKYRNVWKRESAVPMEGGLYKLRLSVPARTLTMKQWKSQWTARDGTRDQDS